uniref:Glycosyltransferase 2-like domain-containing protein n=1 Tax=viral metagenome TaxID=1070528 RepID=A0A6C0JNP8_9ZZZZ
MDRRISLAIPYYNNSDYILEAINSSISDDRVNEIIICDDKSNDIDNLENILNKINNNKIKIFKNKTNLGCYHNKIETISKCTNEWAILLDSDNIINKDFIDTLFNIPEWDNNTIYHPCWAKTFPSDPSTHLDYRCFTNKTINKLFYLENFENNNFQCLINNCNYFLPVNNFINCMNKYNNYSREYMDVLDSAVLFTNWLCNEKCFVVVDNLIYNHRLHPKSNFMLSPSHKYRNDVLQFLYNNIKN